MNNKQGEQSNEDLTRMGQATRDYAMQELDSAAEHTYENVANRCTEEDDPYYAIPRQD